MHPCKASLPQEFYHACIRVHIHVYVNEISKTTYANCELNFRLSVSMGSSCRIQVMLHTIKSFALLVMISFVHLVRVNFSSDKKCKFKR